jgi:hypothetical protein
VDGGKLPGIGGTYGVAGWGGRRSDGTNGWSARGSFGKSVPIGNNPLGGYTTIGSYVYHADMPTDYGDILMWVENWGAEGNGGVLKNQAWYCLEVYVELNTPTQNNGKIRAWVDGRPSYEKTDFRFRDVDRLKIENIWLDIYHGGTAVSPADQHLFMDNVVIAKSYVGPMGGRPVSGDDGGVPGSDSGAGPAPDGGAIDSDAGAAGQGGTSAGQGGTNQATNAPHAADDAGCGCRPTRGRSVQAALPLGFILLLGLRRWRSQR